MPPLRMVVTLLIACLAIPSISWSQNATIGVYRLFDGTSACPMSPGESTLLAIKLVHTNGPVKTAKFKLVPSCPGATISGSLDYDLTFSPYKVEGDLLGILSVTAPLTCSDSWGFYIDVEGPNGEFLIPMTDCDGYAMTGADAFRVIDGPPCDDLSSLITAYRPTPADGATGVPVNTLLSYVGTAHAVQLSTEPLTGIYDSFYICGPPTLQQPDLQPCTYPVNPGLLAPNTTYYWRLSSWFPTHWWAMPAFSRVYSFTTEDVVGTEATTWGHVKALYRK